MNDTQLGKRRFDNDDNSHSTSHTDTNSGDCMQSYVDDDLDFLIAASLQDSTPTPPSPPSDTSINNTTPAVVMAVEPPPPPPPPLKQSRCDALLASAASAAQKTMHVNISLTGDARMEVKLRCEPYDRDTLRSFHSFLSTLDYLRPFSRETDSNNIKKKGNTTSGANASYEMDLHKYVDLGGQSIIGFDLQRRFPGSMIRVHGVSSEANERLRWCHAPGATEKQAQQLNAAKAEMQRCLPNTILSVLKPYQEYGIAFAIAHRCRMMFADDMGLGKTLQSIAVCEYVLNSTANTLTGAVTKRILILCPSSLRIQWAREFARWVPLRFGADASMPMEQGAPVAECKKSNSAKAENKSRAYHEGRISIIFKSADVELANNAIVVISTYDLAAKFSEKFLASFHMFVADESHSIKNREAKRTIHLLPAMQRAQYVLTLSGTPMLGRPIDMYTQIRATRPDLFRDFHFYGQHFCGARLISVGGGGFRGGHGRGGGRGASRGGWGGGGDKKVWDYSGSTHEAELYYILSTDVMLRRLKRDVLKELPAIEREIIYIAPTRALPAKLLHAEAPEKRKWLEKQKRNQKQYEEQLEHVQKLAVVHGIGSNSLAAAEDALQRIADDSILNWYNELSPIKLPAVLSYVEENLFFYGCINDKEANAEEEEEEESKKIKTKTKTKNETEERWMPKTIILAHHASMLNGLQAYFEEKFPGQKIARIDGSTSGEARAVAVDQFQQEDSCRVILLSITAAGVGLTLTAASLALFVELHWTAAYLTQAEARCHRIGQLGTVTARYLLLEDSFELDLWKLVERKLDTTSSILDNETEKRGMQARIVGSTTSYSL
jgi:SWI/SNF-related matrix-associated actin-dependent regulator 1 of chromatin subfamily A